MVVHIQIVARARVLDNCWHRLDPIRVSSMCACTSCRLQSLLLHVLQMCQGGWKRPLRSLARPMDVAALVAC